MPVIDLFPKAKSAVAAAQAVAYSFQSNYAPNGPRAWPQWALDLEAQSVAGETGVGDTAERILGPLGGDGFKAFFKATTGKDCGCTVRKEGLNREFPYS